VSGDFNQKSVYSSSPLRARRFGRTGSQVQARKIDNGQLFLMLCAPLKLLADLRRFFLLVIFFIPVLQSDNCVYHAAGLG